MLPLERRQTKPDSVFHSKLSWNKVKDKKKRVYVSYFVASKPSFPEQTINTCAECA